MASQQDTRERAEEMNSEFRALRTYVVEAIEELNRAGTEMGERLQEWLANNPQLANSDRSANDDAVVAKYRDAVDSLLRVVALMSSYISADMPDMLTALAKQIADTTRNRGVIYIDETECMIGLSESSGIMDEYYASLYDAETAYINAFDDSRGRLSAAVKLGHAVDNARRAMARLYMCADSYASPPQ